MSEADLKKATVTTEDCVIHITYTGTGPNLLILIPGGHGTGAAFHAALPGLTNSRSSAPTGTQYTVATFDRRGHGASNLTPSGRIISGQLNPAQSARDVLAITKHLNFDRASIFGTSGGGIIAFQFAIMFPQHVDKLIAHETPTMALLPGEEGVRMLDLCFEVHQIFKDQGPAKATIRFLSMSEGWKASENLGETDRFSAGTPKESPSAADLDITTNQDHIYWFENEYIVFTIYTPNLLELKAHLAGQFSKTMSCACVAGKASGRAPYALTTYVQRDILACQHHMWPGGHLVYVTDPEAFVQAMSETLEKLET